MWTVADRLRKARELTDLKPADFADEIGVSRSTIKNYEAPGWNRERKPIVLKAWALRSGVSYDWLVNGTTSEPDGPGTRDVSPTKWYGNARSAMTVVPLLGRAA